MRADRAAFTLSARTYLKCPLDKFLRFENWSLRFSLTGPLSLWWLFHRWECLCFCGTGANQITSHRKWRKARSRLFESSLCISCQMSPFHHRIQPSWHASLRPTIKFTQNTKGVCHCSLHDCIQTISPSAQTKSWNKCDVEWYFACYRTWLWKLGCSRAQK